MMNTKELRDKSRKALVLGSLVAFSVILMTGCGTFYAELVGAAPNNNPTPRIVEVTAPAPRPTYAPVIDIRAMAETVGDEELIGDAVEIVVDAAEGDATEEDTEDPEPAAPIIESTLEDLDATWNLYTNLALGFEIKVPKQMGLFNGDCYFNEEQSSYRPKFAMVDTAIFEDNNSTFLTYSRYADLQGKNITKLENGGQRTDFSECVTVSTTLDMMKNEEIMLQWWEIKVTEVADEAALLDLVKAEYGSGCEISEMATTDQEGTYDLNIVTDGKDFSESTCPVNYGVVIRYAPELGKVAIWNTGQAGVFIADETYVVQHDLEARDSFRFLP